ncbi:hypothetical protein LTS18_003645 [Coniosporium uncinatum]|uniref:Uncharacterized protein n=1 Tax=Coniosporium uncinatum TaxID=93489 RepID=A0ACC3D6J9_9PEZI|nr:hypothetical protein LTS18_003645 [Coniosporium uncinatum]
MSQPSSLSYSSILPSVPESLKSTLVGGAMILLVAFFMAYSSSIARWAQRKQYQYEVTFSLYMLTPTEKFIFNSLLFLILSLVVIATSLYLPEHIINIANRAFYYWAGELPESQDGLKAMVDAAKGSGEALGATQSLKAAATSVVNAIREKATETVEGVGGA